MNDFRTDALRFVQYVADTVSHLSVFGSTETNKDFEKIERVLSMPLNVNRQCLDCGTRRRNIIHGNNPLSREVNKIESITRQGEQRVEEFQLVQRVVPIRPETRYRRLVCVVRGVREDGDDQFEGSHIHTLAFWSDKGLDDFTPVKVGTLENIV